MWWGTHGEQCPGMLWAADVTAGPFWCLVPQGGGGGDKASPWPGVPSLIWLLAAPLECSSPSLGTPWQGLAPFSGRLFQSCLQQVFPGPAVPHAAALECLQQERYQDTAACHCAWGYCGKSQLQTAARVLEAPAETEHQQLLAQPCLCASHLAKMETEPSPGFVSYMPQHNATLAASAVPGLWSWV